jgi:hypothetical protein
VGELGIRQRETPRAREVASNFLRPERFLRNPTGSLIYPFPAPEERAG